MTIGRSSPLSFFGIPIPRPAVRSCEKWHNARGHLARRHEVYNCSQIVCDGIWLGEPNA
jgi:hypothetical protein